MTYYSRPLGTTNFSVDHGVRKLCAHVGLTEKAAQGCRSERGARAGFSGGQEGRARYLARETSEQGKRPSSPSHQEAGLAVDS